MISSTVLSTVFVENFYGLLNGY